MRSPAGEFEAMLIAAITGVLLLLAAWWWHRRGAHIASLIIHRWRWHGWKIRQKRLCRDLARTIVQLDSLQMQSATDTEAEAEDGSAPASASFAEGLRLADSAEREAVVAYLCSGNHNGNQQGEEGAPCSR